MADEVDERSALLQNGHTSEAPEVNLATSSALISGFLLPICNWSISDFTWTDGWSS